MSVTVYVQSESIEENFRFFCFDKEVWHTDFPTESAAQWGNEVHANGCTYCTVPTFVSATPDVDVSVNMSNQNAAGLARLIGFDLGEDLFGSGDPIELATAARKGLDSPSDYVRGRSIELLDVALTFGFEENAKYPHNL